MFLDRPGPPAGRAVSRTRLAARVEVTTLQAAKFTLAQTAAARRSAASWTVSPQRRKRRPTPSAGFWSARFERSPT